MSIVPYTLDVKYNTHMKPDLEEIKSQQQHVCKIFFTLELFYALVILSENTGTVVICSNVMFLPVFYLVLCDGLGGGEWSWWWCWLTNSRVKTCFNTCTGLLVLIGLLTTHGNTLLGHSQKYFAGGGVVGGSLGWYCSESIFHDSGMNQF